MSAISRRSLIGFVLAATAAATGAATAADTETVGRVRVVPIREDVSSRWDSVERSLDSRFSPAKDSRFADKRIISLRPSWSDPTQYEATIFDYGTGRAYDLVLDFAGNEISRHESLDQPARSMQELSDAYTIVRENPAYASAMAKGELQVYEAMPPVTVDGLGRRLINVGVMSRPEAGKPLARNEIVSVFIPTGEIVQYPTGAPDTSRAPLFACGPGTSGCSYATGPCSYYQITWPAADPVWKLNVRHPSCTSAVQGDGTGLEITDVYYRGRLILKRAEVPVLNVKYTNDSCGPFRDWLTSEDCFTAVGTDVPSAGSGIRVASSAPSTLCESGSDAGNFMGVAIYDQGDALWLMTETNAGWYRYVMEWRLHLDGTIDPIFGFGATSNGCTCNQHFHHAYWRMEWAIDATSNGTTDDPATGINTLERHRAGSTDDFDPVTTEGSFVRPAVGVDADTWRVKNPLTGNGYIIKPGSKDGTAAGDTYAKWDLTALALNSNQINDPNSNTSIDVSPWVSGETLGASKRLVTWYHATWQHDDPGGIGEACELAGPRLIPTIPCAGSISIDRPAYTCGGDVTVTMTDSDLASHGTAGVAVLSATEPTPETLTLTETPPGSGRFTGSVPTTAAAAAPGDGMISVADGDTLRVRYLDVSACGTPNVTVEKTAPVDCSTPAISGVRWTPGVRNATITWDTSEHATSVVHYGLTVPTGSAASTPGAGDAHSVVLSGLTSCTTYYFWVESADAAGNVAASNHGGGYYAFTTGRDALATYASSGPPVPIPDNNATGATSSITIPDAQLIQDADVTVAITHTYDGDLNLSLISPSGTTIPLSSRRGGSGHDFTNTIFNDEAATAIASGTAPFTGSYRPESPLSAVGGALSSGVWQFKVVDLASVDVGTIDSWSLGLTVPAVCDAGATPPPVPEGTLTASRVDGTGKTVHLAWDAATCPAKNYHLAYGQLAALASYTTDGGVCGLGPLGSYDWEGVADGDLWFVAIADDASTAEGSWGTSGPPVDRNGASASGYCGFTTRTNSGTCP